MLRGGGPSVRIWRARWTPPSCANADREKAYSKRMSFYGDGLLTTLNRRSLRQSLGAPSRANPPFTILYVLQQATTQL